MWARRWFTGRCRTHCRICIRQLDFLGEEMVGRTDTGDSDGRHDRHQRLKSSELAGKPNDKRSQITASLVRLIEILIMADTVEEPTGQEECSKTPGTHQKGEEYLRSILRELGDALSTAIAGESMRPMSTDSIVPPLVIQSLRKQLQSLQSEFWSALHSDGYHRGMIDAMTLVPAISNIGANLLKHIKDMRDSKCGHGEVTGFCVPTVCDVFFEQAVPWGAMALEFVERCKHTVRDFLASVLAHLTPTDVATALVQTVLEPLLSEILPEVQRKLADLLSPSTHGYPLIYDPDFHDYIHHGRQVCLDNATRERLRDYSRKGGQIPYGMGNIPLATEERLVEALTKRTKAEADEYACMEMLSCAKCLYQKNVPVQCLEVGMLTRLSMAISPDLVQHIDSEVLDTLAIKSPDARLLRLDPKMNQGDSGSTAQQRQTTNDEVPTTAVSPITLPRTFQWQNQESPQRFEQTEGETSIPEGARRMKEKAVLYFRHKLQRGFLARVGPPEEDELHSLSVYLGELEAHPDLEGDIVQATKVNKVLEGIIKLASIPQDNDYRFKDRSLKLLAKWNEILAKEGSGDSATKGDYGNNGVSTPTPLEPVDFPFASNPSSDIFTKTSQQSMPQGTGSPTSSAPSIQLYQPTGVSSPSDQASQPSSGFFNAPSSTFITPAATSSASNPIQTPTPSSNVPSTPLTQTLSGLNPISFSFPTPPWGRIDNTSPTTNAINTNPGALPSFTFGKFMDPLPGSNNLFGDPSKPVHPKFSFADLSKPTRSVSNLTDSQKPHQTGPSPLSPPPVTPSPFTKQETSASASTNFSVRPSWSDCPGTGAYEVFHAYSMQLESGEIEHYQHVVASPPLRSFSPEECRLADYKKIQDMGEYIKI
ncbi:MAG: hypothetical protein Q9184_005634 [Pyrenodesmia sp. 2 TL-2023]